MAFLFNKEKNKYIELNLFTTNEKDWIAYSMCGGNIYQQTRKELFRLDNEYLYFHNTVYENEIEKIINGLSNIKESCRYTFEPVDEGEFRLESDYKGNVVYIKCTFFRGAPFLLPGLIPAKCNPARSIVTNKIRMAIINS